MNSDDSVLIDLLTAEIADYVDDEPGWAHQAARQVVEAVRLAGWAPRAGAMPAEEEPEGIR